LNILKETICVNIDFHNIPKIIQIVSVNSLFVKTQIKNESKQAFFRFCFITEPVLKKQFLCSLFMFFF